MFNRSKFLAVALSLSVAPAYASTFWPSSASEPRTLRGVAVEHGARVTADSVIVDEVMVFPSQAFILSGFTAARWPDGRLVYDASGLTAAGQAVVAAGCAVWTAGTTITCVKRTTETGGYLKVVKVAGTASTTTVGYPGAAGTSTMSLCCYGSTLHVAHELGHVLGLSHEQSRSDRGAFVRIVTANIKAGAERNFLVRRTENHGAYDFRSIMHYKQRAFSSNGKPTIEVLPPNEAMQSVIGNASALSTDDTAGMAARYASAAAMR